MLEQIRTFLTAVEEGNLHRAAVRLRISQPAVNGKERSLAEYNDLFEKVGLRTIKTTPLDNGYVVIETAVA
jgi:hypothetical protein